jgi:tyrosinase
MHRYVSQSIDNPGHDAAPFQRADLVLYGVDHSGPSFEARVFFNAPDANVSTARDDAAFAGSFTVFGHAGCAGDVGHCEVPTGPRDPFDRRPPHALTPQTKTVIVTDALRRVTDPELVITIVAVAPGGDGPIESDALRLESFRLLTFD